MGTPTLEINRLHLGRITLLLCCSAMTLTACMSTEEATMDTGASDATTYAAAASMSVGGNVLPKYAPTQAERYQDFKENTVKLTSQESVSTLSLDVDTGSYSNVRRFIESGQLPPKDAVRIEELINYFDYKYPTPTGSQAHPFILNTELAVAPWNTDHLLMRVGVKAVEKQVAAMPPANLVFLVDVSGSMEEPDKLPLVKSSLKLLVDQLREQDRVSLIVYAGRTAVELPSTPGSEKAKILAAIDRLTAEGSTAGEAAMRMAYDQARANFIKGGVNRVLLATDGDFNVGITDTEQLIDLVEKERSSGVTLTTIGFGTGNYNEAMMERVADAGNGNYAYIDSLSEAQKVLVEELSSTFNTVAKDVKIQVEFNPAQIAEWRLIGYENRVLNEEDFRNDRVDAAEVGAGKSVTALYELTPVGKPTLKGERRYAAAPTPQPASVKDNEIGEVRLRYKKPDTDSSVEMRSVVEGNSTKLFTSNTPATSELNFAAAVAAYGQLLRNSHYVGTWTYEDTAKLAEKSLANDSKGYRQEFVRMVELTSALNKSN